MMKRFRWALGSHVRIDPQAAGEELSAIEQEDGRIDAARVVQRAADKASALHKHFEWNDAVAGPLYRLHQARHLVLALRVEVVEPAPEPRGVSVVPVAEQRTVAIRPFVFTRNADGEQGYKSISKLDKVERAYTIQRARRQLQSWRDRFHELRLSGQFAKGFGTAGI